MTSKASHQLTKAGGHDGASQALYSHSQLLLICAKKETHCSQSTMALTLSSFKQSTKTTTASSPLLGARLPATASPASLQVLSSLAYSARSASLLPLVSSGVYLKTRASDGVGVAISIVRSSYCLRP